MPQPLDCPRCHTALVKDGPTSMRCDECNAGFTATYLASRFYRPSEYIHAERVGLEREGWDTPPFAA